MFPGPGSVRSSFLWPFRGLGAPELGKAKGNRVDPTPPGGLGTELRPHPGQPPLGGPPFRLPCTTVHRCRPGQVRSATPRPKVPEHPSPPMGQVVLAAGSGCRREGEGREGGGRAKCTAGRSHVWGRVHGMAALGRALLALQLCGKGARGPQTGAAGTSACRAWAGVALSPTNSPELRGASQPGRPPPAPARPQSLCTGGRGHFGVGSPGPQELEESALQPGGPPWGGALEASGPPREPALAPPQC